MNGGYTAQVHYKKNKLIYYFIDLEEMCWIRTEEEVLFFLLFWSKYVKGSKRDYIVVW